MNTAQETARRDGADDVELVTFYVGDMLIGADIRHVDEINRQVDLTPVPQAPDDVRGVMNLRGDVVTVLDLRIVLGMGRTEIGKDSRNVIVNSNGERTGLLVDRVADVVTARRNEIYPPPANMSGLQARFVRGVYKLDHDLLTVLDIGEILAATYTAA